MEADAAVALEAFIEELEVVSMEVRYPNGRDRARLASTSQTETTCSILGGVCCFGSECGPLARVITARVLENEPYNVSSPDIVAIHNDRGGESAVCLG